MRTVLVIASLATLPTAAHAGDAVLSDWMPIAEWSRCAELVKPGIVFEIRSAAGDSMLSPCTEAPPAAPWDWTSPMVEFRAVPETPPRHSDPIPAPAG